MDNEQKELEKQSQKISKGVSRLIDSYADGYLTKDEFEPRIRTMKARLKHIDEQRNTIIDQQALKKDLHCIITNLETFANQVHSSLSDIGWEEKRAIIRMLVKKVEIDLKEVNVVFKVGSPLTPKKLVQKPSKIKICKIVVGVISPILANIYLHYGLDLWFARAVKPRLKGRAFMCRYADDWVCGFQFADDARRFYEVLPKRLARFNLEVEPSKTQTLRFSRFNPSRRKQNVFGFLGFEFYWWPDRSGTNRIQRRTARKKQLAAVQRMKDWIKKSRHLRKHEFFGTLNPKLIGHYNYYYVRGNSRAVWSFYGQAIEQCFKWLNRRSQRKSYTWPRFKALLDFMSIRVPKVTEKKRRHTVALC